MRKLDTDGVILELGLGLELVVRKKRVIQWAGGIG